MILIIKEEAENMKVMRDRVEEVVTEEPSHILMVRERVNEDGTVDELWRTKHYDRDYREENGQY